MTLLLVFVFHVTNVIFCENLKLFKKIYIVHKSTFKVLLWLGQNQLSIWCVGKEFSNVSAFV